jgi:hypothetical protein
MISFVQKKSCRTGRRLAAFLRFFPKDPPREKKLAYPGGLTTLPPAEPDCYNEWR